MKIVVTEKGRNVGVSWPSTMSFDSNDIRLGWLVFAVTKGYATVEPESDIERAWFDEMLDKMM